MRKRFSVSAVVGTLAVAGMTVAVAGMQTGRPSALRIDAISTSPDFVTGGDLLVEVKLPSSAGQTLRVTADGRDVTAAFKPAATPASRIGLVSGLPNGSSRIVAEAGGERATLDVTNYPITGPVFSGPWIEPFICQTEAFKLPDGSTLGPALDQQCSAKTVVHYVYRSTTPDKEEPFKPLPDPSKLPADVAKTTTLTGETVNFVVRLETGTMNRGIYQNAILHDPTTDPAVSPSAPPRGWNRRLVALHGFGCSGGWYIQGAVLGKTPLDLPRLAKGYAVFNSTLTHQTVNCNPVLSAETAMMGKEHFIETFGVPLHTLSTGTSGGSYTSLQIADLVPGLFDGLAIGGTFPDAMGLGISALDARLLQHYWVGHFARTQAVSFTRPLSEDQLVALGGYHGGRAMVEEAIQSYRTDPVPNRVDLPGYTPARWNGPVPDARKYDPVKNPGGARPTIWDVSRNIYGVDASGAALSPYDNVGVQYGLSALKAGLISVQQFLDLNEFIGGYDRDTNYTATRTAANADAIKRAYQGGMVLGAQGGVRSIPIFDEGSSNETGGYHYGYNHFVLRERLRQANGGKSDNLVFWRSSPDGVGEDMLEKWMTAYKSDTSSDPQAVKVQRAKPSGITDGCYDKSKPPQFIGEDLRFSSKADSKCSAMYPVYANPRLVAGAPLALNVLKCQLKPVDLKEYAVTFSPQEQARLAKVFPAGVCDWSKPGINQTPVVPWASFGPSPKNLVFKFEALKSTSR